MREGLEISVEKQIPKILFGNGEKLGKCWRRGSELLEM